MNRLHRIAVFCGSNLGVNHEYTKAVKELAFALRRNNLSLVYGGASVGLMGVLADSVLTLGGEVIGVIPEAMTAVEISHKDLTELFVVKTMHERKAKISDLSDGFILLPGGAGSLDEFFEIFTWLQLGYHRKPCAILNTNGYYDPILQFIEQAIREGFMKQSHRDSILVEQSPEKLISVMFTFSPVLEGKWIRN